MVSCTAIEAQIVFEMLLVLVTSQLAIAGQLGREVYLWSIRSRSLIRIKCVSKSAKYLGQLFISIFTLTVVATTRHLRSNDLTNE